MPKLQRVLAALAGEEAGNHIPDQRPLVMQTDSCNGLFPAFLTICQLIDVALKHPGLDTALGLEDMIYRWMAASIVTTHDGGHLQQASSSRIDVVCDLVRSSTERPLTLTEMELASGLSARALQYAFKARFGCSPMAWQRKERMLKARKLLLANPPFQTITTLAHDMGFSSASAFSTLYKRHFGETPSQTLSRQT